MKFVPTRALRINPAEVWKLLQQERDLVITSNGKPVGVLTLADEDSLEDVLATLRQGRAQAALAGIRRAAVARGLDRLPQRRVQEIVGKSRKPRRLGATSGARR
jgi:PHD/YefM family antitoxin component YafN of YafNO toxin-antitoxin module